MHIASVAQRLEQLTCIYKEISRSGVQKGFLSSNGPLKVSPEAFIIKRCRMSEIQKTYDALKKKHALPSFNDINNEFEISSTENKDFLLREIRRKMDERIEFFVKILNSILQPDTNISELHECRDFSDSDKRDIFSLYKEIIVMHDSAVIAGIICDESQDAKFISETFKSWPAIKKKMVEIVKRMKDSWKTDVNISEELGYLG